VSTRTGSLENAFDPLPFDAAAARSFGRVAAGLRRDGRRIRARAFDALIAATAMATESPVYTCNARDFEKIGGLDVVAIPHPDQPVEG
jgi:predicted nucleic acid-binding protein